MRSFFLPTVALVCWVSAGCQSETARVHGVAETFLLALKKGDEKTAQSMVTLAARPKLALLSLDKGGFPKGEARLGTPSLREERAEVPFSDPGQPGMEGEVLLRREEKEWRVWGLRFKDEEDHVLTLDLENPEKMVGEAFGMALGELAKGLLHAGKDAEKTGRALGAALGGFLSGFHEGLERSSQSPQSQDKAAESTSEPATNER